ncbi:hypothetical protein ALON55S_01361 [Alishewanella longhuensis]
MRLLAILAVVLFLNGCSAMHTSISKGKLDVQTRAVSYFICLS